MSADKTTSAFPYKAAPFGMPWGTGMSIRTYIATAAMNGILADSAEDRITNVRQIAQLSVELADELIAELNKPLTTKAETPS